MTDPTPDTRPAHGPEPQALEQELAGRVEEVVTALLKAVRSRQTYVPENPLVQQFEDELSAQLQALWNELPHLSLAVDESRLLWRGHEVYGKPVGKDNFAFRFFKDGIRLLAFLPGVEEEELSDFLDVLTSTRLSHDEDLLANLWHRDFKTIRLEYVDATDDETLEVPEPDRGAGAGESLEDMSEIEAVLESGPVSEDETAQFADVALGEPDLMYLRREMEAEWGRPLVHDVTLALLDQFEMRDQERRRQVVDILRELLPRLLADNDFGNVALIVNELQLLANKTGEDETQVLVTALLRDMSEAMAEMVSAGGAAEQAGSEELAALVGALQAEAIPTLVRAVPSVSNVRTRTQLAEALDRLVSANPGYVVDLLSAEDPMLAAEAARIVGRLGLTEAEQDLLDLVRRPADVTRQAGIEALALLGSQAGTEVLAEALADPSREIRLAAVNAIIAVRPPEAESLLGSWVAGSDLADRDQGEQMAFFKAYAAAAGDEGVPALAKLLNGRKWWGGRHPPSLRANAARTLGIIASGQARRELERAAGDRAAPVRSAVRVALRALESDSDERVRAAELTSVDPVDDDIRAGEPLDVSEEDGPAPDGETVR